MIRADRLAILKKEHCSAFAFSNYYWWICWDNRVQVHPEWAWEYPLLEGRGFIGEDSLYWANTDAYQYDTARCGAFADWLEENTERLTEKHSDTDRPLAAERLRALAQWLRSGFQTKGI